MAIGINRKAIGFEISKTAYKYKLALTLNLKPGYLLDEVRNPPANKYFNQGKSISNQERRQIVQRFSEIRNHGRKKASIEILSPEFGRGDWSLLKVIDGTTNKNVEESVHNS